MVMNGDLDKDSVNKLLNELIKQSNIYSVSTYFELDNEGETFIVKDAVYHDEKSYDEYSRSVAPAVKGSVRYGSRTGYLREKVIEDGFSRIVLDALSSKMVYRLKNGRLEEDNVEIDKDSMKNYNINNYYEISNRIPRSDNDKRHTGLIIILISNSINKDNLNQYLPVLIHSEEFVHSWFKALASKSPSDPKISATFKSPIGKIHGASNDRIAEEDQLGFRSYAKAFAELIMSSHTSPPLTIGIYGAWGIGKSTLLDYIGKEVDLPVRVIKFNAWEYNSAEAIWPSLVRGVMDNIESKLSFYERLDIIIIKVIRVLRRFLANSFGFVIVVLLASFFLGKLGFDINNTYDALKNATMSAIIASTFWLVNILNNPISRLPSAIIDDNKYGKQLIYMKEIREDLELLQNHFDDSGHKKYLIGSDTRSIIHKNKNRILVIIDDLDRCEPDKVIEVLQAINLILNFDKFIVCLGIDHRIINSYIENYYKKLLGKAGASGYEYLEKIIQIPFKIPVANENEIKSLLLQQIGDLETTNRHERDNLKSETVPYTGPKATIDKTMGESIHKGIKESTLEASSAFEEPERQSFIKYVPFMRPNPRHIKRMINIYRLVRMLAIEKGEAFIQNNPSAVIRWLLICGQWPYTTYEMLCCFAKYQNKNGSNAKSEEDILESLFMKCKKEIDKDKKKSNMRHKLDYNLDLLESLIKEHKRDKINADDLRILERYTLNFNPALDKEFEFETETQESK